MSHWFFLSYARENYDQYLLDFYRDLNKKICDLATPGDGEDGFLDMNGIEVGKQWPDELTAALQKCQAFISLYSPAYFTKEYCGKEWRAFSDRQAAYGTDLPANVSRPSLIMPVLWVPENRLPSPLPDAVSTVQYKHNDFGEEYARVGLKQLMAVSKYRDDYLEFLAKFADKLIQAVKSNPLPHQPHLPPINEIESAFHVRVAEVIKPAAEWVNRGPRSVQFFFVAARRDELKGVREKLDPYGEEGGYYWQPYFPEHTDEVGGMALQVAVDEKLRPECMELDDFTIERLDEAESNNKLVAIFIDTWTLCLPRYNTFMNKYDRRNFVNCVVLIAWNDRDGETEFNRPTLTNNVWGTFPNHAARPDPNCFLDSISSHEELKKALRNALINARGRISMRTDAVKKKAEGGQFIGKPLITGVGRASV
jgi:FxsC-like protein